MGYSGSIFMSTFKLMWRSRVADNYIIIIVNNSFRLDYRRGNCFNKNISIIG